MKKSFTTFVLASIMASSATAQNLEFVRSIPIPGVRSNTRQIKKTSDNNFITVGTTTRLNNVGQNQTDISITKINPDGDTLWVKFLDQPSSLEFAQDFEIKDNGDILIGGLKLVDTGEELGLLICTDAGGNLLWEKTYGETGKVWEFRTIKLTPDAILLGGVRIDEDGDNDALIVKADLGGNLLWSQTVGGPEYEDAWDIEVHPSGGYVFTGGSYSFAQGEEDDAWIVKLHENGDFAWRKMYGTPDMIDWAWRFVPSLDANGMIDGYVFTGLKESGTPGTQGQLMGTIHFIKVDTAGNVVWDKSIVAPNGQLRKEGTDITMTSDGGFAICGWGFYHIPGTLNINAAIQFLKSDNQGNITHEILFDPNGKDYFARSIVEYEPNNFYISGTMTNPDFNDSIFVAKVSIKGNSVARRDNSQPKFDIFPNPTNDYITISNTGQSKAKEVQIYSIEGRFLKSIALIGAQQTTLSLAGYSGQTLIIAIIDDKGDVSKSKIIVN